MRVLQCNSCLEPMLLWTLDPMDGKTKILGKRL